MSPDCFVTYVSGLNRFRIRDEGLGIECDAKGPAGRVDQCVAADHASRTGFVKRSVRRFWPGEEVEDALRAAQELVPDGITTILTKLGENLTKREEAEQVTLHYLEVFDKVAVAGLDAQVSVKPTQLGLDLDRSLCERNLDRLIARAEERNNFLWIDMESSPYADPTLELFRRSRAKTSRIGIALQAYLYRTAKDIESLFRWARPFGSSKARISSLRASPIRRRPTSTRTSTNSARGFSRRMPSRLARSCTLPRTMSRSPIG